ncbi:protein TASOR isoform 2-T2 [Pelodytes ibericus]
MASGERESAENMKEEKPSPVMEEAAGRGSPSAADGVRPAQNGGLAQSGEVPGANSVGLKPTEEAPRKRFQIPRKSREKKALQLISSDSREFEEILKILHSSFLDANSKTNFTFKCARLVHNEFLEKEFTEKRRQLKFEGRLDKELVESYAFLLVDQEQIHQICERGLHVDHSRITTLGNPSMGVYLSRFADLLQANPLESNTTGNIFIFKVIKGKMKCVYDYMRNNQADSFAGNGSLDPAPKHECHILKNMNVVTSLLSYRAFERTQYYFYEYGFDEVLKRPRHVCPYAVVSFNYKDDPIYRQPSLSPSVNFSSDRCNDRSSFTLWRGQLLSKGKLLCYASLKSTNGPFLPYRLPEKLDLEMIMRIDQIKQKIPSLLFYRETHNKAKEAMVGGIYSRLYEVVDKTRTGSHFQSLLQRMDRERLALVKPLADRGFLFLFFPTQMTSSYGSQIGRSRLLHALFIYRESREPFHALHVSTPSTFLPDNHEIMPDLKTFISALHVALHKSQQDTTADFNIVVEKHARIYLKRRAEGSYKYKEYIPKTYDARLDFKKSLYPAPKDKSHIKSALMNYVYGPDAYTVTVEKAKELIKENLKLQQFSPVSDYEPIEDDHEVPKAVSRSSSIQESSAGCSDHRQSDHTDYDLDKLNGLINLIQSRKQNTFTNPETDEVSTVGFKRKLDSEQESQWKRPKNEEVFHHDQEESMDAVQSMSSFISALGGQDTDLRQENSETPATHSSEYVKMFLETLAESGYLNLNSSLAETLEKVLSEQKENTDQDTVPNHEDISPAQNTSPDTSRDDESTLYDVKDQQSVEQPEGNTDIIAQSPDDPLKALEDADGDTSMDIEESILEPRPQSVSPCPSTPTETTCRRSCTASNVESEMHWKLIPITGLDLTDEELVYVTAENALPQDPRVLHKRRRRRRTASSSSFLEHFKGRSQPYEHQRVEILTPPKREHHLFQTKHCPNGLIENTVLEVYSSFSERLHEVLTQKNIAYNHNNAPMPLLSSDERTARLSDWLYEQASNISVEEYVEELHEKLNSVVIACINPQKVPCPNNVTGMSEEPEAFHTQNTHPHAASKPSIKTEHDSIEVSAINKDYSSSCPIKAEFPPDIQEKPPPNSTDNLAPTHNALANLINQMNPEIFNNLVKIFTHVNKNIVKFYIHTEEENTICEEIKDYLLKLGNAHCDPEKFLSCDAASDKLLIIIQNEDIAHCIHKIPRLITLKTLACVSFAGVDTLDDLKNHTYNELFVSGGFIVSDETVLNPETMTSDALKKFLLFLEEITSPEGKWQWKIHCKFQKKLKELGRVNTNALNMLTLLTTYQKKHLVEILSYHNCDSQTRQAPELECLIRLQVQNIHQRHVLFITEKDASLFPSYSANGIVVTRMEDFMSNFTNLIGFHSSNPEENGLSQLASQDQHTVLGETDVKEEEDMSLDSEDETPQIEVSTDSLKLGPIIEDTAEPPSLTDAAQTIATESLPQNRNLNIDLNDVQPVTTVSAAGSATADICTASQDDVLNNLSDYPSTQLGMSHQFSHFNVLTHQTFLGTMYPILANQPPPGNYFPNSFSQVAEPDTPQSTEWEQKWNLK